MAFEIRKTKNKAESVNKSLYLPAVLAKQVQQIANENNTSFNNVVVSMIEACLPFPSAAIEPEKTEEA